MAVLELEYTGEDLVISKEKAENELGLRPGDRLLVRAKVRLVPAERTEAEKAEITRLLEEWRDSITQEDIDRLENWQQERKRIWTSV